MDQSFFTFSKLAWILLTPGNLFVLLWLGQPGFTKTLLTRLGLDPNRPIIESESRNTYENFVALQIINPTVISALWKPAGGNGWD